MSLVQYLGETERDAPPSTYAIVDLLDGKPGALVRVAGLTVLRAGFIVPGLYIAGVRRDLLRTSLAASASITLGMILWKAVTR
jgi:hypothetical protein